MEIRRPLEWHCKQMDHFVGLNFSANFNFALVGHLLKGNAAGGGGVGVEVGGVQLGFTPAWSCVQATDTRPPPPWPGR